MKKLLVTVATGLSLTAFDQAAQPLQENEKNTAVESPAARNCHRLVSLPTLLQRMQKDKFFKRLTTLSMGFRYIPIICCCNQ
jgi:hypothetical protein